MGISQVLWQFLMKWLTNSALFPREASTIAPYMDALYFFLLGLIDASGNKIGSPVANILTYCYHYDPQTNKHSLIVVRVVQLGGMATAVSLGSFMLIMFRRDPRLGREHELIDWRTKENDKG